MKFLSIPLLLLLVYSIVCHDLFAQANLAQMGFGYSALVRDTAGRIQTNKPTRLRFTILIGQNGTVANAPHIEEHNTTTDDFGFVNLTIGQGNRTGGTAPNFSAVDFSLSQYWLVSEVWNNFQNQFEPLSKTALQAVPYAKIAGQLAGGSAVPTGTIIAFGGPKDKIPNGWMLCDGRQLSAADPRYQSLFSIIGTSWGASGGAGTFNLPNTLGMFLRGVSDTSNQDPDKLTRQPIVQGGNGGNNVGSYQKDEFSSHTHQMNFELGRQPGWSGGWGGAGQVRAANAPGDPGHNHLPLSTGGNETRPKNVNVNYIIKL